jgi:hypothetical protein
MTLTTHAVVGAAIASLIPEHPVLVFCAAFASHFVIDAIPHWDYAIASSSINPKIGAVMKYDEAFFQDVLRIGTDALLGILLSLWLFGSYHPWVVLLGACAGILPDPLQFIYTRWRHEPLVSLQRFHQWIHTNIRLRNLPALGIASQLIFLAATVACTKLLF